MLEIRKIISEYEASAYRRVGARMLVQSSGIWVGGISGGCLEGDALKKSLNAIYKNEPSIIVYDTMEDDSSQIGVGLGCNGRIEVLLTPIDPKDPNNEIEMLRSILNAEQPSIIAKVISKESHHFSKCQVINYLEETPQFLSFNESNLQETINTTLAKKTPRIFELDSEEGKLKVLLEFIRPETRLIIVGDSYDVNAMVDVTKTLGWEIWVVGRMKKLAKELVKKVQRVIPFEEHEQIKTHDYTAVVLMSHDYKWDMTILQHFVKNDPPYIGILGPKKRTLKMDKELDHLELEKINFIHSPTGLEIGAETPEEISLSIAAEIIAVFRNKKGLFLKLKEGSIHTRES